MKKDKFRVYFLELFLIIIFLFALFASNIFNRKVLAVLLFFYMIFVAYFVKKREKKSNFKKQVAFLMVIFGIIYLVIYYSLGLYFEFVKSKVLLSTWSLFEFIIPLAVIIICSEILRNIFLSQKIYFNTKKRRINLSLIFTYIMMVLIDLLIYTEVYDLSNLDDLLTALGFVLFASLSCNLLYNHLSSKYGSMAIIPYRLITILYVYIIPVVPDIYIFFTSFIRMIYPYIIYIITDKLYSKYDFVVAYNSQKSNIIGNTFLLIIISLIIMLISCQFKYGILVIGSYSMTGTIDKGDAVLFEKYEEQPIQLGQIIVFDYNGIQTIHRVVDIRRKDGELIYFTKGDFNKELDDGYITSEKIIGLIRLKIKYIGRPTLWFRSLFE